MVSFSEERTLASAAALIEKNKLNQAYNAYHDFLKKTPINSLALNGLEKIIKRRKPKYGKQPSGDIISSLVALYDDGRFDEVSFKCAKLLNSFPTSLPILNLYGSAKARKGLIDASEAIFRKATLVAPYSADLYYNLAVTLHQKGDWDRAYEAYQDTISIARNYANAYNNIGNLLQQRARFEESLKCYEAAINIKSDHIEALKNKGISLHKLGRLEHAYVACLEAKKNNPNDVGVLNQLGILLQDAGKFEDCLSCYRKAIELDPSSIEAYSNICTALENWNRAEELATFLTSLKSNFEPLPDELRFYEALIFHKQKKFKKCEEILARLDIGRIPSPPRKLAFLELKAKNLDALKNFSTAFNAFVAMNKFLMESWDYKRVEPESYYKKLKSSLAELKNKNLSSPVPIQIKYKSVNPIFLIGFPRSGTTMLDMIIKSHSKIETIEERPLIENSSEIIGGPYNIDRIEKMTIAEITDAQNNYIDARKQFISQENFDFITDRHPMNILRVPFIHRIFPEAKFILALRHPLDCILSCWMQNFAPNPGMANMTDLTRIAELYDLSMKILDVSRQRYNLNIHHIKYENIVDNFEYEISKLLQYFNLEWENNLSNFHKTAIKSGRIKTKSYSQVSQKLYKTSVYRWQNYESKLVKEYSIVETWMTRFDYFFKGKS